MLSGESDLSLLLHGLNPVLHPGEYVFCTVNPAEMPPDCEPLATFQESEGLSLILDRNQAEKIGLTVSFSCAWITLSIHSALNAVGLTAAVSGALARQGIPCNIVAGYYHDHLFIPLEAADQAMQILRNLKGG
jgi:hypothetical protein